MCRGACYDSAVRKALLNYTGILLLLASVKLFGASGDWFARPWQSDEGLPDNNVTGIVKTPDGFLWVATSAGLARFDGVRFEEFLPTNLEGVPGRGVRALALDRQNQLWMVLDRGIIACVGASSARVFTPGEGLPPAQPQTIAEDSEGGVWFSYGVRPSVVRIKNGVISLFGTNEGVAMPTAGWITADAKGEIWLVKNRSLKVFRDGKFQPQATLREQSARIATASNGGLWICSGLRLSKYEEGLGIREVRRFPSAMLATALMEDRDGAVWIGTAAHGLFRHDDSGLQNIHTSHPQISCLMQSRAGNIWAGTSGGGLNRLRVRTLELLGTEAGLPFESVRSVCGSLDDTVWVVTQNGMLARTEGERWTNLTAAADWPGGHASCVASDPSGAVWIGTSERGLMRFQNGHYDVWHRRDGLNSETIRTLFVSASGDVWFSGSLVLQRMRRGQIETIQLPSTARYLRALAEDTDGNVWIGTSEGQLLRVKVAESNVVEDMTALQGGPSSIRTLHATPDGALWIGYAGAGLGRIKDGKFFRINSTQGLHDNFISQIVADKSDRLWLGGNSGISHISIDEFNDVVKGKANRLRAVIYGRGEGLPSVGANYDYFPGSFLARDGSVWVATRLGLAVVHTETIRDNPEPPPVLIERVAVDGQTAGLYDSHSPLLPKETRGLTDLRTSRTAIKLRPDYRKLEIDFTALSFAAPENVSFRYRLDGYDEDWQEGGIQRTVNYPRLGAGNYQFHVKACNNAGVWNETGAALGFTVLPFFWQTWPFRVGAFAVFTLAVIGIVRYVSFRRLRRQVAALEQQAALHHERTRIAKDIHDDLGANLTQISLLSELAHQDMTAPEKAGEHLEKISTTARQVIKSLDEIVWAVNPRNDTLPHLIDYLGQFTFDFLRAPGIRCRLDLPERPPALNVSSDVRHNVFLAVKEALNNIVKHARASEVWLRVNVANGALRVSVEDNGLGFEQPPEDAWADGLRNMRQRLSEIGGECRIESRAGAGTQITFEVPWQKN